MQGTEDTGSSSSPNSVSSVHGALRRGGLWVELAGSFGGLPAECPRVPQFSLLSEVRGIISPQDLDRFDHLVLRREIESMKARQPVGPAAGDTSSVVSYSDAGSSTGSHGTSTTVSSARVSRLAHALVLWSAGRMEGDGPGFGVWAAAAPHLTLNESLITECLAHVGGCKDDG